MITFFKKTRHIEYNDRILKAFPHSLKNDVEVVLSILPFDENDVKLCDGQVHKVANLINEASLTIQLDNELLTIPYRIYFNEPVKENELTDIQKIILNCIYLRHHDGYLRQKRLEQLIGKNEFWIIPFIVQLLGEYVFEILEVIDKCITNETIINYTRFITANPKYWQQTESRMISYWNAYYRKSKSPKLKEYIGWKIVSRVKKANA